MARPASNLHLQPKNGGWRARVLVPVELQAVLGKKLFHTPVWRVTKSEAAALAWPEMQKFHADEKSKFRGRAGAGMLPIIPLVDKAAVDETLDPWPKGKLDPERYRDAIEARFRAIFELELSGGFVKSILSWVGAHATQRQAADYVIGAVKAYLKKAGL